MPYAIPIDLLSPTPYALRYSVNPKLLAVFYFRVWRLFTSGFGINLFPCLERSGHHLLPLALRERGPGGEGEITARIQQI